MSPSPASRPCRAFLDDFSAFVDGYLSPARRDEIQAHVDCCQGCLDHLTAYRRGITVLRSLQSDSPADFWERLEHRLWPRELTVLEGGRATGRASAAGRWPGAAVAAAAVLALFVIVRGMGPESTPGRIGPQRIQASVAMTLPEVPEHDAPDGTTAAGEDARPESERTVDRSTRPRGRMAIDSADPAEAVLARVDSRTASSLEREIWRLRDRVFEGSLSREAAESALVSDGWVQPVRLGNSWSRTRIQPALLVRPASAVRPAPWNVDRAASLP